MGHGHSHGHGHSESSEPTPQAIASRKRANWLLAAVLVPLGVLTVIAMMVMWPSGSREGISFASPYQAAPGVTFDTGKIQSVVQENTKANMARMDAFKGEKAAFDAVARAGAADRATREAVTMRGKANMNIVIGGASGLRRLDPDYEAALVSNAVFGQSALASRVGRRVRDSEGLSYEVSSRYALTDLLDGVWRVNVNVAPQNTAKALRSTLDEIAKYAREGATDAEVAVQKNFFAGNYQVNLGSNPGVAAALVSAEKFGLGPRYLDEFPARIRSVTTAQANAALRKHFAPDKLHVIVAGDLDNVPD